MGTPPWRINEVLERAVNGPICLEKDFDLKLLVPELRRVIKEYDISFDPMTPVPSDNDLADNLWKAAMDLYLEVGTLCTDTHRRILFTEAELKEAGVENPIIAPIILPDYSTEEVISRRWTEGLQENE